ncbi:5'-nucleotidase domain-containing protein 3 [Trichonephila inaurata madagascariensis]|uniref:5'-nucleotidase domain-containing protein 3 n=1 Tax=Trichonephila inaurata madagascariensis TaxID=2747483 RepID=A0A8X6X3B6_9ARAC|nr:5'-nucleotidase domain-containing protein 3 [Trichonephila inaurata madagascariensis]
MYSSVVFRTLLSRKGRSCFISSVLNPKNVFKRNALQFSRNSGSKVSDRDRMLEKYYVAKQAYEANLPPPEVNPFGVFANNELNLGDIDVYGFDYDYTLAVYKESLHYLIYELGRNWLVNKFKYPSGIQELPYQPGFAIRGLHYDMQEGILMKIDSFHQIQFESVFRGTTPLEKEEVVAIYGGSYIPQELIRGSSEGTRMKQLNDLFSVPEICLLSNVTEYFEKNNIPYLPEILSYDIQNAVQSIHPVMHKMLDESTIGQYLEKLPDMTKFLNRLKNAGKKMFLITNSPFKFVDTGMTYMIGPGWTDLFDVIVVQARKPKFFTDQSRPFRIYDVPTKSQLWEKVTSLQKGNVYMEGNLKELQRMTNWYGSSVLYFGDQIYSDLADLTLHHGWRTGAIIYELTKEIEILNSEEFRHDVGWLQTLQHLIEEMQDCEEADEIIQQLLKERDLLRVHTKKVFNKQFGSIFRTHHNPTYFSRRLFRYSDIYMSQITNLLNYSLNHIFYPRRGALPHECKIPFI